MDATVYARSSFTIKFRVKLSSARLVLLRGERKYIIVWFRMRLCGCLFQGSQRVIIIRIVVYSVIIVVLV